jgi:alpha-amylase/alpha-mannosidase (GH57 family)
MERYICIHGHFYQPPRENPWLEAIEVQDSAYPYHDWNVRITAECYAPNATSRILDKRGRIDRIVNNYAKMSFNFGPTLLAWMEVNAADVYEAVLGADRESRKTFSGHGSALAQAYNHMILPLANRRDKYTQIVWGLQDFQHRFGREPEGMWLPETAVDLETLDILAELGIRFTILAPRQASRVRASGDEEWQDVSGAKIDPTTAYTLSLPSGRTIVLFFYDDPISRAIAFEGLLRSGESFARRLLGAFSEKRTRPQLVHIATDGETYGHHHRFGDMALAYALDYIESNDVARLTNYGRFLEKHPPTHEVEIFEQTSWSCTHGVERWRSDCGCKTGGRPGWHQAWRGPLREALDWLRDTVAPVYEEKARSLLDDPWEARNDYIEILLHRSHDRVERFLSEHAVRELNEGERISVLELLELQRQAMLMYTSCGWFFNELSGIETIQVIQYAGRALQLARKMLGDAAEARFFELLEQAKSNVPDYGDGRRIYEKFVTPAIVNLEKVCAHYAISSLFEDYNTRTSIYCYVADQEDYQIREAGKARLVAGKAKFTSEIIRRTAILSFGVLHLGDHILNCGVKEFQGEEAYRAMMEEIFGIFATGDFPEIIRRLDKHFGDTTYSLKSLFRDEQRKILNISLASILANSEAMYRQIYDNHAPLIRFVKDCGVPVPKALYVAAEVVLNANLRRAFGDEQLDYEFIEALLEAARLHGISLDVESLEYILRKSMERMAGELLENPTDVLVLLKLETAVRVLGSTPFEVNLREVQNICYGILQTTYADLRRKAEDGDEVAREWLDHFGNLGEKLSLRVI